MSGRLIETLAPRRLGPDFRRLLAATWLSNLGDGIALAAGPLLVAALTDNPVLIAAAAAVQWLPPLLFGMWAGVLSDRLDRRHLVVAVDVVRAGVLLTLTVNVQAGTASIAAVLFALFAVATLEVFADNASATLTPMLVAREDLPAANSRTMGAFITVNQLLGPPVGAVLFLVEPAAPFAIQAVLIAVAASIVAGIRLPASGLERAARRSMRQEIGEGVRWVRHHVAVRTLVSTIFVFNLTWGAAWSVLVLYSAQRLDLGGVGFGLITTVSALGGLLGMACYGRLVERVSLGDVMRYGLILETLTHLGLAITTTPWIAMPIFFLFGAHAFVWGTTSMTIRQRAVPTGLQGRVGAINSIGTYGGLVLGSVLGGALAHRWGVTAPFWYAFVGSAVFLVLIWRQLRHIAHDA
ncbi:MAG: MFS transporter [Sporichthyaceae bacterium]